jgi:hypothetical protein
MSTFATTNIGLRPPAPPPEDHALDPDDPLVPGWDEFQTARRPALERAYPRTPAGGTATPERAGRGDGADVVGENSVAPG